MDPTDGDTAGHRLAGLEPASFRLPVSRAHAWNGATSLDHRSFESFLGSHDLRASTTSTFDLEKIRFARPSGLVSLMVAAETAARYGRGVVIRIEDDSFRRYLSRARFSELSEGICRLSPSGSEDESRLFAHRYGRSEALIELTKLDSDDALHELRDRSFKTLRGPIGLAKPDAWRVVSMISEIGTNVLDHAEVHGYAAMQAYSGAKGRFLEFAVGDGGRGIRSRLADSAAYRFLASDLQAVQYALKPDVSSFGDGRGLGLPGIMEVARTHRATLQIRSGQGGVRLSADTRRVVSYEAIDFPGTQVTVILSAA
jgi:hypothetical protein